MFFFCQRLQYWEQECNKGNIVLFSTNPILDVLYVSDNTLYQEFLIMKDIIFIWLSTSNNFIKSWIKDFLKKG